MKKYYIMAYNEHEYYCIGIAESQISGQLIVNALNDYASIYKYRIKEQESDRCNCPNNTKDSTDSMDNGKSR
jgi:hypothetical protein